MIEPFARVWLSELQSGTRVVVGGVSIEGAGQNEADKINAAFESTVSERVKNAVEEFRDRAARVAEIDVPPGSTMIHGPHKSGSKEIAERIRALPAALEDK